MTYLSDDWSEIEAVLSAPSPLRLPRPRAKARSPRVPRHVVSAGVLMLGTGIAALGLQLAFNPLPIGDRQPMREIGAHSSLDERTAAGDLGLRPSLPPI